MWREFVLAVVLFPFVVTLLCALTGCERVPVTHLPTETPAIERTDPHNVGE